MSHYHHHPTQLKLILPKFCSLYIIQSQPSRVGYFFHELTNQRVFGYFGKEMGFGDYEHPFLATAKHDIGPA